jgi:RNA polymerase sigma-70 factor (ECF subfamily)
MSSPEPARPLTRLLLAWRAGEDGALDALMPEIYASLRGLAGKYLRSERDGHTLSPTALVHEAFLRLVGADLEWQDRVHFFAVAARTMRRVLVDYARERAADRRGGGNARVTLDEGLLAAGAGDVRILDVNDALDRLAKISPRQVEAVELVFFGGLTYVEAAGVLNISEATLHREIRFAKAFIEQHLRRTAPHVP